MDLDDLGELVEDWRRSLKTRNRSPRTIDDYASTGEELRGWLAAGGRSTLASDLDRRALEDYLDHLSSRPHRQRPGRKVSPATVAKQYRNLQQFCKFLINEGVLDTDPFARMTAPAVPEQPVPVMSEAEVRALLWVCDGPDFEQRRDAAIIRVLLDTGVRVSELVGVKLTDLNFGADTMTVLGKGRRRRDVAFGNKPAQALRRYLRVRRVHPKAERSDYLWIGRQGRMTDHGVRRMLERRAEQAGVAGVHPHRFRHQFAHDWLSAGGNETDLMRLAGWRSRQMLTRYGASAADERAHEAHRRAGISDKY